VVKRKYIRDKALQRAGSVLAIQSAFRGFLQRRKYKTQRGAVMKAQANVLARQQRRAFLKLKQDTTMAQAYIKRYLAMSWLVRVKDQNDNLNEALRHINDTIGKYNQDANKFKQEFQRGDGTANAPQQLDHMTDFEGMQKKAFDL